MIYLRRGAVCVSICLFALFLFACNGESEDTANNEEAVAVATNVQVGIEPTDTAVPPTNTPEIVATDTAVPTNLPPATFTLVPTATNLPATDTPLPPTETLTPTVTATLPTSTPRPTATNTPIPATEAPPPAQPTTAPVIPQNPVLGVNLLANGSFEGGWYHTNGIGELQTPDTWVFEWDEGPTGYGSQSWDVWVRPEMRVLSRAFLPPSEHSTFIFDGDQTVKIFKGNGAISYRFYTEIALQPGAYIFETNVFTDLYIDYQNDQKVWADDPFAGEVRFITPDGGTGWFRPAYGSKNNFTHSFVLTEAQTVRVGMGLRGRYAIANNGWFLDDWSLQKVEN